MVAATMYGNLLLEDSLSHKRLPSDLETGASHVELDAELRWCLTIGKRLANMHARGEESALYGFTW